MSIGEIQQLAQLVNSGGVVFLLLLGIIILAYGSFKEWWISGPAHIREVTSLREERDAWRTIALSFGNTAEKSVQMAEVQLGIHKDA